MGFVLESVGVFCYWPFVSAAGEDDPELIRFISWVELMEITERRSGAQGHPVS